MLEILPYKSVISNRVKYCMSQKQWPPRVREGRKMIPINRLFIFFFSQFSSLNHLRIMTSKRNCTIINIGRTSINFLCLVLCLMIFILMNIVNAPPRIAVIIKYLSLILTLGLFLLAHLSYTVRIKARIFIEIK